MEGVIGVFGGRAEPLVKTERERVVRSQPSAADVPAARTPAMTSWEGTPGPAAERPGLREQQSDSFWVPHKQLGSNLFTTQILILPSFPGAGPYGSWTQPTSCWTDVRRGLGVLQRI